MPLQQLPHMPPWGVLGMMAKFGPLARREVCDELSGVVERLITHLHWLVGSAAMLVAVEEALAAVEVVNVVDAMGAAFVFVTGAVVVLLVLLLEQSFAIFGGHPTKGMPKL